MSGRPLFDQADTLDLALVSGEASPDVIEQPPVYLINDLELTRQQPLEPCDRPFLKRFGQ